MRVVVQLMIPVARAMAVAWQQALTNARREGATAAREALKPKMSSREAAQILNIEEAADASTIEASFKRMFEANEPNNGGSFYIQSKIYRARQRLAQDRR